MRMLAAIDIGTVTTRLIVAKVGAGGTIDVLERLSTITDLGEGVDASGALKPEAIDRTCATVRDYVSRIRAYEGPGERVEAVSTTTTSAARDASNASDLVGELKRIGLEPQVIAGGIEARLSLLGVTGDFVGETVLVADIGGGSTELTVGRRRASGELDVGASVSYNVGCRRVAERFLAGGKGPAGAEELASARAFVADTLGAFRGEAARRAQACGMAEGSVDGLLPATLVCVGGTATSLVSVANRLVPYDSSFVHLHRTARSEVSRLADRLCGLTLEERRELPGLQPKRAAVIGAGAVILDELMKIGDWDCYVASEADSLFGLLTCMRSALDGTVSPIGWHPTMSA